jgi:apolipoprotein N-acyltransferase
VSEEVSTNEGFSILKFPIISALLCGVVSAFALPYWSIIPLFFIGFSLFLAIAHHDFSGLKCFMIGWAYGFGYFTVSLYWIANAMLIEDSDFWWAYPFALFGLPLYLSMYYGFATLICQKLTPSNSYSRLFSLLFTFALMDFARGYIFTGFPWNSPGLMWIESPEISQIASIGGLIFLSAITYFWASIFYVVCAVPQPRFRLIYSYTVIGTLSTCFLFGYWELHYDKQNQETRDLNGSHEIIIVQPNIPQHEKWNPHYTQRNISRLLQMSENAIHQAPDNTDSITVIWPETALSFNHFYTQDISYALDVLTQSRDNNPPIYLLTGLLDGQRINNQRNYTNSVVGLNNNQKFLHYNKHHLVPFGEYMPYQDYLGWMPLTQISGFQAGTATQAHELPNKLNILPLICYEIIFPKYSFAAKKTDFIVNITNDGWYGDSAGPAQHLAITQFRAIEQGRITLRAANTGISAIIDSQGQKITHLDYGTKDTITHNFKYSETRTTIYQKYNYLVFILYLSSIFLITLIFKSKYK